MDNTKMLELCKSVSIAAETSKHPEVLMKKLGSEIGPRTPGSKGIQEAIKYLSHEFEDIGANDVHTEQIEMSIWHDQPAHFELTSPQKQTFQAVQHVYSKAAKVSGELIDAGTATPPELDQLNKCIKGNILLVGGRVAGVPGGKLYPIRQRVNQVCEKGAAGVVVINRHPHTGPMMESLSTHLQEASIPVIGVSCEDGEALLSYIHEGNPSVLIETAGKSSPGQCANLVAELGPQQATQEVIGLSAHLDTFYVNPGAFDNLTGVITLMEIARVLSPMREQFKRKLRLVLFSGHEYGYAGSIAYIKKHKDTLVDMPFLFNMDGLFGATAKGVGVMWAPKMCERVREAYQRVSCDVEVRNIFCMSSDYLPFMLAGVPAARPADWTNSFPPNVHTSFDVPSTVPIEWIRKNAATHAQMLLSLLIDPEPLPNDHNSYEEVRSLRKQNDIDELLTSYGL